MRSIMWVALLMLPFAAHATKLYKWVDPKTGQVSYGSSPPPEAAKNGAQKLNDRGIVVDTTKSQAELTAAAATKKQDDEKRRLAEKQAAEDRRLLNAYSSENDLLVRYNGNIELIDQQMAITTSDMASRQKNLDKLVAQAAENERMKKPVNEQLKTMISAEREEIERQRSYIVDRNKAKVVAKQTYDKDLARYREVLKRNSAASAVAPVANKKP